MIDRDPDDRGLEASPAFVQYMADLRKRWPRNEELAAKHGVSAGNGHYDSTMTKATTDETEQPTANTTMGRRAFCVGAVGTIVLAGAGTVAADEVLDFENDAIPNPGISATVSKETHELGFDPVRYFDDSMEEADLPAAIDDSDGEIAATGVGLEIVSQSQWGTFQTRTRLRNSRSRSQERRT